MKRILIVAGLAESLVNFRSYLLTAFLQMKYEVHVAAPLLIADSETRLTLENMGVVVHDIPLKRTSVNWVGDVKLTLYLFGLMRRLRPEQTLCYTVKPVIYGTLAAWAAGVRSRCVLITGLGYAFQEAPGRRLIGLLVRKLYSIALSKAEVIFFQNPDDRDLFISKKIVDSTKRLKVVNGSGVNLTDYNFASLEKGPVRFLLIARLLGDKGVREFAQAARFLKPLYPEASFMLAGWFDENPDCIRPAELESWINEGVIDFLGRLSDVRPALGACTVFVLPSYREGTPRTVLEAMSVGRAIITTDAPGCRETVVPGRNGLLVQPRSVEALVNAMVQFLTYKCSAEEMGLESRKIAKERYDVHAVNRSILSEMMN